MTERLNITRQDVCELHARFVKAGGRGTKPSIWTLVDGHRMLITRCAACKQSVLDHQPDGRCP